MPASDMDKDKAGLSAKERALIETARQSLAARRADAGAPPTSAPAAPDKAVASAAVPQSAPPPAVQAAPLPPVMGTAERIALLMQAEREQTEQHRARLRRWGIYAPLAVLIALIAWAGIKSLRLIVG